MRQNITKLENFYNSPLGYAAKRMVLRRLHALWPHMESLDVLGYGYDLPYLSGYEMRARHIVHAMPARQGAARCETRRGNNAALVGEAQLPFASMSFDRVLIAHGLEEAGQMSAVLTEMWRVMKPEGRIVIVVANRAGLWARSDKTPFGAGRPFSRRQLSQALKLAGFVPLVSAGALYCPPINRLSGPRISAMFETFGETVWPGFCGIVLVEAVKRLYVGQNGSERKAKLRPGFSGALGVSGKIYQPKDMQAKE